MSAAPFLTAGALKLPGVAHAFFTRRGGVSEGVYASLNGGVGSRDAPEAVAKNRARMAAALGVAPDRLAVPYQVHSPDARRHLRALGGATRVPAATESSRRRRASRSASPAPTAA